MEKMLKIKGQWWNGRESYNKFEFNNFFINKFEDLYKTVKKEQGLKIELEIFEIKDNCIVTTNKKYSIKKDAGAYKFYIKNGNKFEYIKTSELKKIL